MLADPRIRVEGSMTISEDGSHGLEVVTDHTLIYAVRPSADAVSRAALAVHRAAAAAAPYLDREDLADHQVEVEQAAVEAGPLACASAPAGYFRPLLAGQTAPRPAPGSTRTTGTARSPPAAACSARPPAPRPVD